MGLKPPPICFVFFYEMDSLSPWPIVFQINGSITSCSHHFSYSNNDHLLSSYLLLDGTCVRCLTYLILNPLNPTRLLHMIPMLQVRGLRLRVGWNLQLGSDGIKNWAYLSCFFIPPGTVFGHLPTHTVCSLMQWQTGHSSGAPGPSQHSAWQSVTC